MAASVTVALLLLCPLWRPEEMAGGRLPFQADQGNGKGSRESQKPFVRAGGWPHFMVKNRFVARWSFVLKLDALFMGGISFISVK